jgi:hypothetical protein
MEEERLVAGISNKKGTNKTEEENIRDYNVNNITTDQFHLISNVVLPLFSLSIASAILFYFLFFFLSLNSNKSIRAGAEQNLVGNSIFFFLNNFGSDETCYIDMEHIAPRDLNTRRSKTKKYPTVVSRFLGRVATFPFSPPPPHKFLI